MLGIDPRNRLTVQNYRMGPDGQSHEVSEGSRLIVATIVSYGDHLVQVSRDDERSTWEIEVIGPATVYHR